MFVFNCKVDETDILSYKKNKKYKNLEEKYDTYQTVFCKICNTKVAVYDPKEELYHFFNVIASHS